MTLNGKFHIFSFAGLRKGKTWRDTSRHAYMFTVGDTKWQILSDLPVEKGRLAASAEAVGGKVYVFGRDGVADVVWSLPTYQAGRFTKTEVFELPFLVKSSEKGSQAMWDYIQKNALDEFKGTKLLITHLHDGNQMHFGSKSVKTLEDLKGLKLRAPSRIGSKTLAALGAVPVQMPY